MGGNGESVPPLSCPGVLVLVLVLESASRTSEASSARLLATQGGIGQFGCRSGYGTVTLRFHSPSTACGVFDMHVLPCLAESKVRLYDMQYQSDLPRTNLPRYPYRILRSFIPQPAGLQSLTGPLQGENFVEVG